MFKHLLVPVDGGPLTKRAIQASIDLAQQLSAAITGFIAEPLPPLPLGPSADLSQERDAHDDDTLTPTRAAEVLAEFATRAKAAGVVFNGHHEAVARVDRAIIAAAESRGCDMIVMVTHGRGIFGEFLFGSQTKAVLAGSKLPLLVLH